MDTLDTLKLAPFNLNDADIAWVKKTRDSLSACDKVRQIYCPMGVYDDPENAKVLAKLKPGGLFRLIGPDLEAAWNATRIAIESSDVPMLIAGDLEGGAYCLPYNTAALNQIGVAACNDAALSEAIATVIAEEGALMGYNWSFTPVLDINAKFRSAIVGTRSYGSNVDTIVREAVIHIKTMQTHGIATTAKHWPGEGYDDRDQHLVTTVNPLSYDEWEASFGKIYRHMINHGVMSVMSAHIALPSWVKMRYPNAGREAFRPGSVSRVLNVELLRDTLEFNGVVVSDATPMGGLSSWAEKEEYVPDVVQNGCDMYLFGYPNDIDIGILFKALSTGRLTEERLEEAVTRVLGLKAALGLHKKNLTRCCRRWQTFAKNCAQRKASRCQRSRSSSRSRWSKTCRPRCPLRWPNTGERSSSPRVYCVSRPVRKRAIWKRLKTTCAAEVSSCVTLCPHCP